MKPVYVKTFTRDFALPIVQIWSRVEGATKKKWTDIEFPFQPFVIFEKAELGVSCYMDERGIAWMKGELVSKAKSDPDFIPTIEREFSFAFQKISSEYLSKPTLSHSEVVSFLEDLEEFWSWFEAGWWLWETSPEERDGLIVPEIIMDLRAATQNVVPLSDTLLRNSLAVLFPKSKEYVELLTISELKIAKPIDATLVDKRQKHYFVVGGDVFIDMTSSDIEAKYEIEFERTLRTSNTECAGAVAYKGNVRGTARIVSSVRNMDKVREGDILIAPMTLPDIMPAMQKAAAFVTDEGGVMCHAAIIAREMKKPCVIGTKFATQIFTDGDMVEVDANNGVVRKL